MKRILAVAALVPLAACSGPGGAAPVDAPAPPPLPESPVLDYQIGGASTPAEDVEVVIRDREDPPAEGVYSVCYVNGFQTQPQELAWWEAEHPGLLLRGGDGEYVVDGEWDEVLLDVSSPDNREDLAAIMAEWMAGCAADGYQGVELDNLDSWTRSEGLLTPGHAESYARLLTEAAHEAGLVAGQKNAAELIERAGGGPAAGFDFAVAEECGRYDECGVYLGAYPDRVLDVEYREQDMPAACEYVAEGVSVVLRDLDVTTPGDPAHVRGTCADFS
ncbi:endo alpha-1,4 polygalactosaminidase [Streptomonospora sp. S1-112]|uniref:Endo alpha-1,4 polygalactosaminidase n=1 Tax=Streptomonospora mangrovi TaxID=2883123 RepID=A0A9X3NJP2_9ACTN|nr:endo alpha-1,4 polygalactosaminidase [Streptomonospora mangrovi]MDA0565069.1 endo alpha-1,4 polygalactosaminidase [Streptomonospora mangrovi]